MCTQAQPHAAPRHPFVAVGIVRFQGPPEAKAITGLLLDPAEPPGPPEAVEDNAGLLKDSAPTAPPGWCLGTGAICREQRCSFIVRPQPRRHGAG